MMKQIDRLIDTREKRQMAFGCLATLWLIVILVPYLFLGIKLLQLSTYADVFALLKGTLLTKTYVSRFVLLCLEQGSMNMQDIVIALGKAICLLEILGIGAWLLLCHEFTMMKSIRNYFLISVGVCATVIVIGIVHAFSATTLMEAVQMMHWIGVAIIATATYGIILHIIALWNFIHAYLYALEVEVIEIDDDFDLGIR